MKRFATAILLFVVCVLPNSATAQITNQSPSYEQTLAKAKGLMDKAKLGEAFLTASAAVTLDDKRWEAYGFLALILQAQGASADAKVYLTKAIDRAPSDKKAQLIEIGKRIAQAEASTAPPKRESFSPESRRSLEILKLILEDADKAKSPDDRKKFLEEFMARSETFLKEDPSNQNVWMLRALTAVELNMAQEGREAGQRLTALGAEKSQDGQMIRTLAKLERKGWLGDKMEAVKSEPPSETPVLFPAEQDGKWGFIDVKGKLIIPPNFEHADLFSEGLAAAKINGKYGYVDASGKFVIEPQFNAAFPFHEGLARVAWNVDTKDIALDWAYNPTYFYEEDCIGLRIPMLPGSQYNKLTTDADGGQWNYVDRTGHEICPQRFDHATDFSSGVGCVRLNGKAGIIGKDGKFVLEPKYFVIHRFWEGLAVFAIPSGKMEEVGGHDVPILKYGYLDPTGKEAIPAQFDDAQRFSQGLAAIRVGDYRTGSWGYIEKTGTLAIPAQFADADRFSEGLAYAVARGKYQETWLGTSGALSQTWDTAGGFIDNTGKFVIGPDIGYGQLIGDTRPFAGGLAAVKAKVPGPYINYANWAFIDRQGRFVIPPVFDSVPLGLRDGLALVAAGGDATENRENSIEGYINAYGRPIWGITEAGFTKEMERVKDFLKNRPDKKAWEDNVQRVLRGEN